MKDIKTIKGKSILIGDLHFGIKRFSEKELDNQLKVFFEQIFPYMEENNIDKIIQVGDLFDNRISADINFLTLIKKKFFDEIAKRGITFYSLLGNHDIYYKSSREVSLSELFSDMYDNFILFKDREYINLNGNNTLIVPWILPDETLEYEDIKDVINIIGHFEIQNFQLVKGHFDKTSNLTEDFFISGTKVQNVLSGHYHLRDLKNVVKYIGTPYQLSWGDYKEAKGFYIFNEDNTIDFIENTSSKKYIKVKYNDESEKKIQISGFSEEIYLTEKELEEILPKIKKNEIKLFVNKSKDTKYNEVIYTMKKSDINPVIVDNQKISEIIGTDYIEDTESLRDIRKVIFSKTKETNPGLVKILQEVLQEVDSKYIVKE